MSVTAPAHPALAHPSIAHRTAIASTFAAILLASFDLRLPVLTVDARWVSLIYRSVDLSAGELCLILAAVAVAIDQSRGQLRSAPRDWSERTVVWLGLLLVGLLALSSIGALSLLLSLGRTFEVALGIAFVTVVARLADVQSWIRRACQVVVLVEAPFVALQEITQSTFPVNTLILSLPVETRAVTPGAWAVVGANGLRWQRAVGTFPHPNVFGGFLALTIVLLLPRLTKSRPLDVTTWSVWLLAWVELLLTFSRAAALAAAIGCVAWLVTRAELNGDARNKSLLVTIFAMAAFVTAGLLGREIVAGTALGGADPAVTDRFALARIAFALVAAHPVLGVGAANFSLVETMPPIDGAFVDPVHVVPLLVAAEAGILAGATWLALVLVPIAKAWQPGHRAAADAPRRFAIAGAILTIGFLDHYLWTIASGRMMFWIALAFLLSNRPVPVSPND